MTLRHTHFTYCQSAAATGCWKSFALRCFWVGTKFRFSASTAAASFLYTTFPFSWLIVIDRMNIRSCTHRLFVRWAYRLPQGSLSHAHWHITCFSVSLFLASGEDGWVDSWLCCFRCRVCLDSLVSADAAQIRLRINTKTLQTYTPCLLKWLSRNDFLKPQIITALWIWLLMASASIATLLSAILFSESSLFNAVLNMSC